MELHKSITAEEAVSHIKSGDNVFVHTAGAAPVMLLEGMTNRAPELKDVTIYSLHTEGDAPYQDDKYADSFNINAFFIGGNMRKAVDRGRAFFIPSFLSEVPVFFRRGVIPLDVALVQVSPPDKHGYCSLGISIDATRAAVDSAKLVIAQINPQMPRTHGDGLLHISNFDKFIEHDCPIPEIGAHPMSDEERRIGQHIAGIIEDGSTLQMGIGAIPDAVLNCLGNHKDLGVHTEMFSDGVLPLIESGVINNKLKATDKNVMVSGFLLGSRKLYDFVDDNPVVRMMDIQYVNDTAVIRKQPKMTSINSAIEIDITGQVCADSIGTRMFSGVGGQMDFIRGASLSEGGKPIIALSAATKKGQSKIVPTLREGAGVVTTRANVHYIATENGIVDLFGKNLRERAKAMISIAHPDHQEALERAAYDRFKHL